MKKELLIGSILALIGLVLTGFFIVRYQQKVKDLMIPANGNTNSGNASGTSASGGSAPGQVLLTAQTVAEHNNPSDCWIIISGKVYTVSRYLNIHPGGAGLIAPYCGRDATTAFATKDGRGSHSSTAQNLLTSFYLGDLGTQASSQSVQSVEQASSPASTTGGGEDEREDD